MNQSINQSINPSIHGTGAEARAARGGAAVQSAVREPPQPLSAGLPLHNARRRRQGPRGKLRGDRTGAALRQRRHHLLRTGQPSAERWTGR